MCGALDRERERILEAMRDVPILLSPLSVGPAFRHGEGGYKREVQYLESMRHSQWLNLVGFPGVSIPMTNPSEGLSIGVQLIGRPYQEDLLLDVAESLELVRGRGPLPSL